MAYQKLSNRWCNKNTKTFHLHLKPALKLMSCLAIMYIISLWFKQMKNFKFLPRFSKTFFCKKISKALKEIIPSDVMNKNTCSARCNQTLFFLRKLHWYKSQVCNLMKSIFQDWFPKYQTPLWWTLYMFWFSEVHTTDSCIMIRFGVILSDFW